MSHGKKRHRLFADSTEIEKKFSVKILREYGYATTFAKRDTIINGRPARWMNEIIKSSVKDLSFEGSFW